MSDIDHTRDCILPSDGKAEGLVRASELFALAAERDALRAENERLKIENIQMQAALGYGILADDERHILPSNPFKCGTCDASKHLRAENERLREWNREIALNAREFVAENERLRAELREMDAHMEENITLTETLRHEQEWVLRLSKALRGVIRVADRNTVEFNEARAALEKKDG
jgi:hypothetical protein